LACDAVKITGKFEGSRWRYCGKP